MKKRELILGAFCLFILSCNSNSQEKKIDNVAAVMHGSLATNAEDASNKQKEKNATMKGYKINIEKATVENKDFRKVLYTAKSMQLVLMSLKPGEEIGAETHATVDQFFRFESGKGKCVINGIDYAISNGDVIIVPAGALHNVINTDAKVDLKLYTIYSPPNHKDKVVRVTKKDAETMEEKFDGSTSE